MDSLEVFERSWVRNSEDKNKWDRLYIKLLNKRLKSGHNLKIYNKIGSLKGRGVIKVMLLEDLAVSRWTWIRERIEIIWWLFG